MLHEVELLEELPYYRSLARPRPPPHQPTYHQPPPPHFQQHQQPVGQWVGGPGVDETPIAIIAPDIRTPSKQQQHSTCSLPQHYSGPGCTEVLLSVCAWGGDVATDVALCCALWVEGRLLWSAYLATALVLASALAVNATSFYWYLKSHRKNSAYKSVGKVQWGVRALAHALLLGLLYRYLHLLCGRCSRGDRWGVQGGQEGGVAEVRKRKQALRREAIQEDRQAALLSLLHSLLESTPQLILQLYAMAQRTTEVEDSSSLLIVFMQGGCALSSLFQTTWSIASYNASAHRTATGKRPLAASRVALNFLWHFCTVGSRACTLALFAREYGLWLLPFCVGHWGCMTVWVMHQRTRLCGGGRSQKSRQLREWLADMLVGVAYVAWYLSVKAEPTRYKYSAYYAVVFAENCALMALWFVRGDPGAWYHVPALVAVASSFASGLLFMLFYYGFCHRSNEKNKDGNKHVQARCC